jgi:hypothetical protein
VRGLSAALQMQAALRRLAALSPGRLAQSGVRALRLVADGRARAGGAVRADPGLPPRRAGGPAPPSARAVRIRHLLAVHLPARVRSGADLADLVLQAGLVAIMAPIPAALCFLANRFWLKPGATRDWLVLPALWVLLEWLRGWLFSGFPWLSLGYAFIDSPLAGWAPLFGVYGVTWAAATPRSRSTCWLRRGGRIAAARGARLASCCSRPPCCCRGTLGRARARAPFPSPPVQGAVLARPEMAGQEPRRDDGALLRAHREAWGARLIVWPEAALPVLANEIPDYLRALSRAGALTTPISPSGSSTMSRRPSSTSTACWS